jgi:diguanylate cyclase (GGDEF)-like protein/PAS domain S-box-containing protein
MTVAPMGSALILVVDDTPVNLEIATAAFEQQGHRVVAARSGEEALVRAQSEQPDLILLDIRMSGMDGLEVCRRLKAQPQTCETPVIFMTALSETSDKLEGFDAGAVDYITKPFQVAEMLARVEMHLKLAAMKNQLERQNAQLQMYREGLERKLAERVAEDLRFFENLDRINSAVRGTGDLEQMMSDLLDTALSIFDCDRAWLVFPCVPEATAWRCPMERTRPEYPPTFAVGIEQPVDDQIAQSWRILTAAGGPVTFGPGGDYPLPAHFPTRFGIQSFIAVVVYPKIGQPWLLGLHQCAYPRVWSVEDQRLLDEIGRRTADALTGLLAYRNLQVKESEFRTLAEHSPDLISRVDRSGRYLYVSPSVSALTGLLPESCLGRLIWEPSRLAGHDVNEVSATRLREAVRQAVETGVAQRCEVSRTVGVRTRFIEYRLTPELDVDGTVASVLCVGRDLTEHKAAERKLAFLAHHDPLTQLPNRVLVRDRFEQAIAAAQRKQARVAMMLLDLDNFKQINDSLGHATGDQLLIGVAERLRSCVRASDTVSREGGDEFALLLTDVGDFDGAARVALQVLAAIEEPFHIDTNLLHTTISIGISFYPTDGSDFETLRKNSDVALFHAKDSGRNTYRFFDENMNREAVTPLQTQANLRAALENGDFRLHYQPQIRLSDSRIVGAEALLRWQRSERDLVAPASFIPAAEHSGLIIPIGEWVLNEACRQAVEWRAAGLPDLLVSVNLSAVQFRRGNILRAVPIALKRSGLAAEMLELELTESVLLHDTEATLGALRALKKIGVRLAIDDFGTGYSSLSCIKRLGVHKLKIDGSFVRGLGESAEDAAIVRAIIQLGRTLELDVVAEGVESDVQLAFLRENGCGQIQGYLVGRPVPPDQFVDALMPAKQTLAG